jgi:hypothetical protein
MKNEKMKEMKEIIKTIIITNGNIEKKKVF